MKSLRRRASQFPKLLFSALFLALAPAALASNTWYVDGVNGNDNNDCKTWKTACKTIGHAISLASPGDTIMVAAATYTETPIISTSLKIIGSGATTAIVDGNQAGTVFTVSSPTATVFLSDLTIQNGGGAVWGGGVNNSGTLTIDNSTVSQNWAEYGGGVNNGGTLTINNSTISGNTGLGNNHPNGGGIYNSSTLTISNTTFSGNGGHYGGNIYNTGSATFQNSIVANATSGGNCSGTMTSDGYNLSDDNTCNFHGTGDLNNTKPKLGKLGYHGGLTETIPELMGSPTVDAGNRKGCTDSQGHPLKTDQRGYPRPGKYKHDKRCDMGAYERQTD